MTRIAVMVSGGGTNLQAIMDAIRDGRITGAQLVSVVASKEGVYALERAKNFGVPGVVIARRDFDSQEAFDQALLQHMQENQIDLIVLAGYLSILSEAVTHQYANRIINIHPALIPSFCGPGHYGLHVHEKALEYGVKVTGATVHFVNEVVDGGAIILQKAVEVRDGDTPESLQLRVMQQAEWELLPRAIDLFCNGKLRIEGRRVHIIE